MYSILMPQIFDVVANENVRNKLNELKWSVQRTYMSPVVALKVKCDYH